MEYYLINKRSEDQRFKSSEEIRKLNTNGGRTGRPNAHFIRKFNAFNAWFSYKYLNHGNIVAHLFNLIIDQINIKGDRLAFATSSPNGRSANKFLSRGLYFPSSIIKDLLSRYNRDMNPKGGLQLPWGYYLTGLMYIWESQEVLKNPVTYDYYDGDLDLPSYTHHTDGPAYELRFKHRKYIPNPKFLFIGKTVRQFRKLNRMDIEVVLEYVKEIYPDTIVVYVPHIWLGCNKKRNETGNNKKSMNAQRLMEITLGIELGWYDDLKRVVE